MYRPRLRKYPHHLSTDNAVKGEYDIPTSSESLHTGHCGLYYFFNTHNMTETQTYRTVLVIAGSDSIGGAGIQADIKTCTANGVYAMTAITAVTAQNTMGVSGYEAVSPRLLRGQLEAVLGDVRPDAVKIGMLPDVASVNIVADVIEHYALRNVVLDPVCVATSGDRLNDSDDVTVSLAGRLLPLADIVTPNIPELEQLTGLRVTEDNALQAAGVFLSSSQAKAVLVKGGHFDGAVCRDILVCGDGTVIAEESPRIHTLNTHGTGCTLSSAIACGLAHGLSLADAVRYGRKYLTAALAAGASMKFGHGHGPVNHIYRIIKDKNICR